MATSRFPTATVSEADAIDQVEDLAQQATSWGDNAVAAGTATITAAQLINANYRITSGTASTLTTDTAANIIAALKQEQVGSSFDFILVNGGSGTATIAGGTGVTILGVNSLATGKSMAFKGWVTGAGAVSLLSLGSAAF